MDRFDRDVSSHTRGVPQPNEGATGPLYVHTGTGRLAITGHLVITFAVLNNMIFPMNCIHDRPSPVYATSRLPEKSPPIRRGDKEDGGKGVEAEFSLVTARAARQPQVKTTDAQGGADKHQPPPRAQTRPQIPDASSTRGSHSLMMTHYMAVMMKAHGEMRLPRDIKVMNPCTADGELSAALLSGRTRTQRWRGCTHSPR